MTVDPAELLSAYLDDELDAAERAEVEQFLVVTPEARRELAGLTEIRAALRSLPDVDPPGPLVIAERGSEESGATSRPSLLRRAAPLLVAAVVVLIAGFVIVAPRSGNGSNDDVAMATGQLVALHRDAEQMMHDGSPDAPGDLVVLSDPSDVTHMPDDLGAGMERSGIYGTDGLVQLVYSDGAHVVSVFEQPHDAAPPMVGDVMEIGDHDAMHQSVGEAEVLMVSDGDMVVTIMSAGALDSLTAMAGLVLSA